MEIAKLPDYLSFLEEYVHELTPDHVELRIPAAKQKAFGYMAEGIVDLLTNNKQFGTFSVDFFPPDAPETIHYADDEETIPVISEGPQYEYRWIKLFRNK